ncbi:MAG: HD domain-containing protein, partial [Enterobacteriaceae bacterium]
MQDIEHKIIHFLTTEMADHSDASHDMGHLRRVAQNCRAIQKEEGGNLDILIISRYFHDIVSLAKNSPDRHRSSELAAQKTISILGQYFQEVPREYYQPVADAIHSHSFSANIAPETLEA